MSSQPWIEAQRGELQRITHTDQSAALDVLLEVTKARGEAKLKALDNLARYKFSNFGYWAAAWVKYNQLLAGTRFHSKTNPFRELVAKSKDLLGDELDALEVDNA